MAGCARVVDTEIDSTVEIGIKTVTAWMGMKVVTGGEDRLNSSEDAATETEEGTGSDT